MDGLIVLLIIWLVISKINKSAKKAKKPDNRKAAQQAAGTAAKAVPVRPATNAQQRAPQPASRPAPDPAYDISTFESHEGEDLPEHRHTAERHELHPSFGSDHVHTEESMTGMQTECPPEKKPRAPKKNAPAETPEPVAPVAAPSLRFDPKHAREAFLAAEILGKPKALRASKTNIR
ncbi:MAG: hypothetical protein Q4C53_06965 [Clostridia bacterium]|nr:hypothetical protein [Clostridia bacterium]